MKKYKTYFSRSDTPYKPEYQATKLYQSEWFRRPYKLFLGHKVYMIKLFGIWTIYENEKLREK